MTGTEHAADPEDLIEITIGEDGRYSSGYREWNGQWQPCTGHDHLTRTDALTCAEDRLRYRT